MKLWMAVLAVLFAVSASAQQVQVSSANKTIAVTAEHEVSAEPDVAVVKIVYQNYATTYADAYKANVRAAAAIIRALVAAGIKEASIQTVEVSVSRVNPERLWTEAQKAERLFEAEQGWDIRVAASEAQSVVNIAMQAGANKLRGVTWDVADRSTLQAEAGGAALAKARTIAGQMAQGLGAKLGNLVYASNHAPAAEAFFNRLDIYARLGGGGGGGDVSEPQLRLFPERVKQKATVHAVFAIE